MSRIRGLLAVAAAMTLAVLCPSPAQAAVPAVPDDVATWFAQDAPAIMADITAPDRQTLPEPGTLYLYPFGTSIGKPVSVMVWDSGFLEASDPTIDMLIPRGDWMAPITAQGKPVGTLTAYRSPTGSMEWGFDDNAEVAAALVAARPKDVVASDGRNGVFIIADHTARQYGLGSLGIVPTAGTLKQLQAALRAQRAEDARQSAAAGGQELSGGMPIDFGQFVAGGSYAGRLNPWAVIIPTVGILAIGLVIGLGVLRDRRRAAVAGPVSG